MKLKDILGICFYYWYGSGGHQTPGATPFEFTVQGQDLVNRDGKWVSTIKATHNFKLHRAFVDNWIVVPETASNNQTFTLKTSPTEQTFFYDDYFKLMKAQGITNIWSATGLFDWLKVAGYSQRKSACYDHSKLPSDPTAWKDIAHLCKLIAERYKDNGLVDYLQVLNEWDFRWNVKKIITPEEYAVCFWECYKAIRSVSPTFKIMSGCTLTPTMDTFTRFINKVDALAQAGGKPVPRDFVYTFNHYVRDQGGNQGGGLADTPESQWEQSYGFYKALNDACEVKGLAGWACTEAGYSTSPSTSFSALKQKAPKLEGVSHEEAQGVLIIRTALMMASFSKCKGVTFYHTKDGYEAEPFTYIGLNYDKDFGGKPDWSSKPGKILIEQFLEKYGNREVVSYSKGTNEFVAVLDDGTKLRWSDKTNNGALTPKPLPIDGDVPPPPPNPTITMQYSLNADRSEAKPLENGTIIEVISGNVYIFADKPGTFTLKDSTGKVIKTQKEGLAPYDLGGTDETKPDKPAKPVTLEPGDYELSFEGTVVSFTVKDGTLPPPPPPTKPVVTITIDAPDDVEVKVIQS